MPIILTGFMGVGKTTVGRILANKLGVPFVDMDFYIEARRGQTIAEILIKLENRVLDCGVPNLDGITRG